MKKINNTAAVFLQLGLDDKCDINKYNPLAADAINSFKKFHPDCDVFFIDNNNFEEYCELFRTKNEIELYQNVGILKFILSYYIMDFYGYDKIISMGIDTITCNRLDEFLNKNTDILATLNYPCQESTEYWTTPYIKYIHDGKEYFDHGNINADIVCFNNAKAIKALIDLSINRPTDFLEQGALNDMAWITKTHPVEIVDFPYPTSKIVYNARSKGVFGTNMIKNGKLNKCGPNYDGMLSPIWYWYVKDNELYTSDHKKIKSFHYVEGLGGRPLKEFYEVLEDFKSWFNPETIKYFKEQCNCTLFDKKLT